MFGGDVSGYKVSLGNLGHKGIDRGRTSKTGDETQPMVYPEEAKKKEVKKVKKLKKKTRFFDSHDIAQHTKQKGKKKVDERIANLTKQAEHVGVI